MRSKYKMPFIGKTLYNYIYKNGNIKLDFYTKNRAITIIPFLLNLDLNIHNGLTFYDFYFNIKHINKKIGEFVFTKKFLKFRRKKKK